jgi:cell division inhibitor SepF
MSSGLWYRTLVYLGLKEEPEDGYDGVPAHGHEATESGIAPAPAPRREPAPAPRRERRVAHERFDPVDDPELAPSRAAVTAESNVRALRVAQAAPERGVARLVVVDVDRFEDVEAVGSRYRTGQAVLFDVTGAERSDARRVIDFVAGLTYALRGSMDRVGTRAFLLVPDGVDLPAHELDRLRTLGYRVPTGSDR